MLDSGITTVVETALEVEARFYEGLLNEAGLHAQVRTSGDPVLTNVIRQIALPRYQVVVPDDEAASAESIITAERRTAAETVPAEEQQPSETRTKNATLLLVGRLLIWLILLMPLLALFLFLLRK